MSAEVHLQNGFALLSWLLTAKLSTSGPPSLASPVCPTPGWKQVRAEAHSSL